jgi:thiamine transport system ATP-binding protein
VGELLDLVGLPGAGPRPVGELSGGEQQRVALARALAPEPTVLLLDEALGALDRTLRERLVSELRALFATLELTVVAVTHDQREAFALADRIAVMDTGRLLQVGSPAEVWERPADARVAELLGLTNVFRVEVEAGRARLPWGELVVPGPNGPDTVLVRPAGVAIDPRGTILATVRASTFGGPRTALELELTGGAVLHADVPSGAAPTRGEAVLLSIDPAATVRLGP